jgi:hypothetical protein
MSGKEASQSGRCRYVGVRAGSLSRLVGGPISVALAPGLVRDGKLLEVQARSNCTARSCVTLCPPLDRDKPRSPRLPCRYDG